MDSRLKERLIGAAVLVALGVWLIPWVLNGPAQTPEPESETETVALKLPTPQDSAPVRAQTIRLDQPRETVVEKPTNASVPAAATRRPVEQPDPAPARAPAAPDPTPAEAGASCIACA